MESKIRPGCRPQCNACRSKCDFAEVINMRGIKIYKHESSNDRTINYEDVGNNDGNSNSSYILHNTRDTPIQSEDIQSPIDEAAISCPRCRAILQHAKKLLTRIPTIGKNVVIGICDHCKIQQTLINTCKKCARVIREFLDTIEVDYDIKEKAIMPWLSNIQKALQNELVRSVATATSRTSRAPRGEPRDLAQKLQIVQRHGFDPANTPRQGQIKLTCTPCDGRSMTPMIDLELKNLIDNEFLKQKPTKTRPDYAEFSKQHKVLIQEPEANDDDVSVARPLEAKDEQLKAPIRSSLKRKRFLVEAREYRSEDYLNTTEGPRRAFQYIFPGEKEKEEPQPQISSSELIKETLKRFEVEIAKAEEERKPKQQAATDNLETLSHGSRAQKSSLERKGSLEHEYIGKLDKDSKAVRVSKDEKKGNLEKNGEYEPRGYGYGSTENVSKSERGASIRKVDLTSEKLIRDDKGKGGKEVEVQKFERDDKKEKGGKKEKYGKEVEDRKTDRTHKDEKSGKLEKGGKDGGDRKRDRTHKEKGDTVEKGHKEVEGRTTERTLREEKKEKFSKIEKEEKSGKEFKGRKLNQGDKSRDQDKKEDKVSNVEKGHKEVKGDKKEKADKIDRGHNVGKIRKGAEQGKSDTEEKKNKLEKRGKGETLKTVDKEGKVSRKVDKEESDKRGKAELSGMTGKKDKEESKETKKTKQLKGSANEPEDSAKMPSKSKNKLNKEENGSIEKGGASAKPLTKAEQEEQKQLEKEEKKRKQEYDKQVREMEKNIKENEQADDIGKSIRIEKKPVEKEKSAPKKKDESAFKKQSLKETKEKTELRRKEELSRKLKQYDDPKGVPLLRVVGDGKKTEETDKELRLTKSQQMLLAKRQREDLELIKQLEERRKQKANRIVIPATPIVKGSKKNTQTKPSESQIVKVDHDDDEEAESEDDFGMDNFTVRDRHLPPEIIVDTNVYQYTKELEALLEEKEMVSPALFKITAGDNIPKDLPPDLVDAEKSKSKIITAEERRGVTSYALSDRTFIEKGWTMLPTEKVVRKMNVYRMSPAQPQFDWFEHNKRKGTMYYNTGERLAEFDSNKTARWYYKNGRPALEYYEAEEVNAQQRIVVYSNGEPDEAGRNYPVTILASFDYLGNAIVFDHTGKIRMKYNQTEGVMLDRTLGPVTQWKWHSLNDPPILQPVMIDNELPIKDETIMRLGPPSEDKTSPENEQMLLIEYDNYIKEKHKKVTKRFKPFQIKMKALKINENFSLRVLNQATVYLHFRDGTTSLKVNLGMLLDNKEILDSDTVEVGFVSNPMQKLPAKSNSLAKMQLCLYESQQIERARVEHELTIRPVCRPAASADIMLSAASRKLRSPFPQGSSAHTETTMDVTGNLHYHSRKPCTCNMFYANQLI